MRVSKVKTAMVQLEAAKEREEIVEKEYVAGLQEFLDWEQAETLLIEAERV